MAPQGHVPTEWVGVSSRGRTLEIVCITFFSLACVTVIMRLIARIKTLRKLLVDDYICIAAQIFGFALMVDIIILVESCGIGWHFVDLPEDQAVKFFKVYLIGEMFYTCLIVLYKLTVLFLYRNVFAEIKIFNYTSWALVAIIIAWWVSAILATMFQCSPVEKTWNPFVTGTCFNQDAYVLGYSVVNLAFDIIILFLPMPMIWGLTLSLRKKIALTGVFLTGGVVCICSVLRLASSFPINYTDPTYGLYAVTLWSQIEPAIGIIAGCLPTLRLFFFGTLRDGSTTSQKYNSSRHMDSDAKSNTAVALTGWRSNEAYTEMRSDVETPKSASAHMPAPDFEGSNMAGPFSAFNFLDIVKEGPDAQDQETNRELDAQSDGRSIRVKQEVSVVRR